MRSVASALTALAAFAVVLGGASAASADVNVIIPEGNSYTLVFGNWTQFAADDVFNAGHNNTVGSNN
ncbi:chaplin [Streptomyces sp. NPDC059917]|uniref:chaplin n=1 Tax=Streptomyces sp. NPDC059917 TaxID=3347002 RepID=UPI00365ABF16